MAILSEREKAIRAAAFIDTDGSIYISKSKKGYYALVCKVNSITPSLVDWMKQEYDGSISMSERPHRSDGYNRVPIYEWRIAAKSAAKFLKTILPFLIIKRKQAQCGLTLREVQGNHMRKVSYRIKEQKWKECYQQMRKLNAHQITQESTQTTLQPSLQVKQLPLAGISNSIR